MKLILPNILLSLLLCSSLQAEDALTIENAWVRLTPAVIKNTAAYVSITNHSDKKRVLKAVECDLAGMVMMHDVVEKDGMTSMVHLDSLAIESGATVQFRPGGMHIMLMGLKQSLKQNQEVTLTLSFENSASVSLVAKVLKSAP